MGNTSWEVHNVKEDEYILFLPNFSATKIVTCKCHVEKSTNSRYDMILGRDLLTAMGLDLNLSKNVIIGGEGPHKGLIGGEGPYKGCSSRMVYLRNY